jgi:hypothetical protein
MDNQHPLTPEGFRTAAYLAARERLDARKTTRNVQCNPPNVRCGNRCIPPTWDCRLKGQGADPHLRAVKTDPLGGLANIQRGFGRVSKGIVKGNFSEVEGGKRAIIRGSVKIAPGNIQQKKELQKKLEDRTRAIGIGLAVVTGGLGIHALLMKSDTFGYRNGVGANINNATRLGVSRVLDAIPGIGSKRARVRAAVSAGVQEQLTRQANPASAVLTGQLARTRVTGAEEDARTNLVKALQTVNGKHGGADSDFAAWNREHQSAFWGVTRVEDGVGLTGDKRASVFARPATDEFLARQFGLQGDDVLTSGAIKDAVERRLGEYKSDLLDLAQQQGYRVTVLRGGARTLAPADQRTFIQGVVRGTLPTGQSNNRVRAQLTQSLEETLTSSPKTRARAVYNETFGTFNDFYRSKASSIEDASSSSFFSKAMRESGVEQTMIDGRQSRAQYVLGLVRPGSQVQGPSHAELALREYHAREVARTPRSMYTISDRLAVSAASEIEGRTVGRSEAFQILEREGFTGAVPRTQPARQRQRPSTEGEAAYQLMRQNPGMTLEAAKREVKRNRGDAELIRTATYLAARADFKENPRLGKPCGASHIPKAHECRKGEGADAPSPATQATDGRKKAAVIAAVAGGALAIAVAGSVAYNLKNISDPTKAPLAASPSIKDLTRQMKKESGFKSTSEAMGYYYTQKSGLKPGDVVYFRHEKDPAAHFGIYLGEGKDGVVRAVIANTKESRFSWTDIAEIGTTKPGVKTSQAAMTPLQKAPKPGFADTRGVSFTNEEVVKRAIRIAGTDYKFTLTKDNCEALANGIAYGVPESEQLQRFRRATRAVVDIAVTRDQRREAREAIYRGKAQGRSYSAAQFVTFLEGKREFSSPIGRDLSAQYAQYFERSRTDAEDAPTLGLIPVSELWSRIESYGPVIRAQAMGDYLFLQRTLVEINRGTP